MIRPEVMLKLSLKAKSGLKTETCKDDFLPRTKNKTKRMSESQADKMIENWNEHCSNSDTPLKYVKFKEAENVRESSVGYPRNTRKRRKR